MKRFLPLVATTLFGAAIALPAIASATPPRGVAVRPSSQAYTPTRTTARPASAYDRNGYRAQPVTRRNERASYRRVHRQLRRAANDHQRFRILARANHLEFTMNQACEVLVTFRSSHRRLEALRMIKYRIVDPHNVRVLNPAFARRIDRRAARQIVRGASHVRPAVRRPVTIARFGWRG